MNYPGGKNGSGVYQAIINQMPPHQVYIEAFLGSGAIMRMKKPAREANIGIDLDVDVIAHFGEEIPRLKLYLTDALDWLETKWSFLTQYKTLIYLDPPYLMETRSSQRRIYRYELSRAGHIRLLDLILQLPCLVMISGYYSDLYASKLSSWRAIQFQACTHRGNATEWLWMNYPEPVELHDYRYLGQNFRDRERIKRKKIRWINRLRNMPSLERYAILMAIDAVRNPSGDIAIHNDLRSVPANIDKNEEGAR